MCLANRPGFAMGVNPSVRQQPTPVRFGRPALSADRGTPVQAPATPDLTSPSTPPLRISQSTFNSPGGQSTGSIANAVRSVGAAPGLNGSTPAMAPSAAETAGTGPLPAPKAPVPRPRNTAILDAGSDGALILQQVRQGLVAPVDAAQRFQDMLGIRDIKPGNKGKLTLSFGEGLARAAQQRAAMQREAQAARPAPAVSNVPPTDASPTQRLDEVNAVRTRIIDGVEVLDAVGGADLTSSPHLLATSLSDTLPNLDVDRIEQLRGVSENDPAHFNNRLVATINDAALRARALTQSSAPSAPGLMRGALARAFGMAIAAASLTGDQRFIDAVLERTEGLPGTGGFRGLANIGRNLLAENSGAPLPARVIANQMLQVHAQQLVLQAGTQVGAADPLAVFPGVGGLAMSAAQRLGTGVASTASRTASRGKIPPAGPVANTRNAVDGVFSDAGPGRASIGLPAATIPGGRTHTAIIPRPFSKPDLGGLFSGNTIGDRSRLRSNLLKDERLDLKRFTGWQAHHVIPWALREHPLVKRLGMNINHGHNGVPLPETSGGNLSVHFGSHSEYTKAFKVFLDRMRKANLQNDKLSELLAESVERTRQVLISGLPKLRKDSELPRDLWQKHFKRLGDDLGLLPN